MVRAVDKADAMLTLSSALLYNIGSHLPFILPFYGGTARRIVGLLLISPQ